MTLENLEQLKVKHRSDEARDILKADLKYLKALFDRLQSEKENAGKASFAGGVDTGVSLSLGGMDMPVTTTSSQSMPVEHILALEIIRMFCHQFCRQISIKKSEYVRA